ncbi:MAG: hypothetical protein ACLS90_04375 [Clostridia bacterium]
MVIVSQDKDKIINFDNLTQVYITQDEEETAYFIRLETVNCLYDDLGEYETEERAKEVLQEIAQTYSSYLKLEGGPAILQGQIDIQPNIFNIPKVYEMPKE